MLEVMVLQFGDVCKEMDNNIRIKLYPCLLYTGREKAG